MGFKEISIEYTWPLNFSTYLSFYDRGLKVAAKKELKIFIKSFQDLHSNEKRKFVDEINLIAYKTGFYSKYLPVNLYRDVILNEINKWLAESPNSVIPYRWSNDININKLGVKYYPQDEIALLIYLQKVIAFIKMNQHELSAGYTYNGSSNYDIDLIVDLEAHVNSLDCSDKYSDYLNTLSQLKAIAFEYKK